MKKYDDFDLDLKFDSELDNSFNNANALPTGEAICWWISLSIEYCTKLSELADCGSQNHDCSNALSACTPCTSSRVQAALRC